MYQKTPPRPHNPLIVVIIIVVGYMILGSSYILFSDTLVHSLDISPDLRTRTQSIKGMVFILCTGLALFLVLRVYLGRMQRLAEQNAQKDTALRTTLERFPGPTAIFDENRKFEFLNTFALTLMDAPVVEAIGKTTNELLPKVDSYDKFLEQAFATGEPTGGEITLPLKSGLGYFVASFIPLKSPDGRIDRVIAIAYDVSERRHSAIRMDKQRKELRQIIDLIPNFVFAKDADGRYIMANEAFSRFHGLSPEEVIGKTAEMILDDPPRLDEFVAEDNEVLTQEKTVFRPNQSMRDSEGNYRNFQVTKIPFRSTTDNRVAVLGLAIDITERLEHERAMNKVRERVGALVDHSLDALFVYGRDGHLTLVNERACQLLGKSREELLHRNLLNVIAGESVNELIRTHPPIFQSGASFQMVLHGDGQLEIPVEIRVGKLPDDEDVSYLAEVRDISERLRTERERIALSRLGVELSAARSPSEVGKALQAAASSIMHVEAFFFAVRSSGKSRFRNLIIADTIDGELIQFPESDFEVSQHSPLPEFYQGKGRLVLRTAHEQPSTGFHRFGNADQISKSLLFAPIVVNNQVVATLSAQNYQLNAYNHQDLDMLQRMADMAAPALESAQANRKGLIFARLGRQLGAARTADDVAQVIAAMADELTGWDCCIIALYSPEEDSLTYIYLADLINGQRTRIHEPYPFKRPQLFAERVLKEGPFLVIRDAPPEDGTYVPLTQNNRPSLSMLWVPIPGEDGPIGLISLQSYAYNAFDEGDLESLKALAEHCGAALNRTGSQELLRYREERYQLAIESTGAVAYQLDYAQQAYIFIGHQIEEITGYSAAEINSVLWKHITQEINLDPRTEVSYDEAGRKVFKEWRAEIRIRRRDGTERWISDQAVQVHNSSGTPIGTLGIIRDITEQKRVELALRASEERYALSARGANDGLWDWDLISNSIHFSERWAQMLGMTPELVGNTPEDWFGLVHPQDVDTLRTLIDKHLVGETRHMEAEIRVHHVSGDYCWMLVRGIAVRDNFGRPTRIAGSQTDITERVQTQERLLHNALHDPLTSLPNRTLLMEHLSRCLDHIRRRAGYRFALVFMDLDRFKTINDSLGHLVGDQVLVTVASRLKLSVRPTDVVARFAGDEFAMVLEQVDNELEFEDIVARVQQVITEPIVIDRHEIVTTTSAGIAIGSVDYASGEELLRDADNALYKSKSSGTGRYCVFDTSMHEHAVKMLRLEAELRRAVERKQLRVHFQPIISVQSGQVQRFEALIRWEHPEWGLLMPDLFMPMAEETGIIFELDEWVISEACRWLKTWENLPTCPEYTRDFLRVNVNLSPRHFLRQVNLAERFSNIVTAAGIEPKAVGLELTENALLSFHDETTTALRDLKSAGFMLYLDDFGKGYSSLSYLHNFPFDMVKIDRQFVARMQDEGPEREIVNAILVLAGKLNLGVVAEGVETARQLEIVREIGCDSAQGFYFSKPAAPEVAIESIKECKIW